MVMVEGKVLVGAVVTQVAAVVMVEGKVQQPSPESNVKSSSRPRADRSRCVPST